jgi:hypothetical protein
VKVGSIVVGNMVVVPVVRWGIRGRPRVWIAVRLGNVVVVRDSRGVDSAGTGESGSRPSLRGNEVERVTLLRRLNSGFGWSVRGARGP